MKTEQTLDLERKIWQATHRQGTFGCFEVTIPNFIYLYISLFFKGFRCLNSGVYTIFTPSVLSDSVCLKLTHTV